MKSHLLCFVIKKNHLRPSSHPGGCKLWKNNIYQIWFLKSLVWGRRVHSFRRKINKTSITEDEKTSRRMRCFTPRAHSSSGNPYGNRIWEKYKYDATIFPNMCMIWDVPPAIVDCIYFCSVGDPFLFFTCHCYWEGGVSQCMIKSTCAWWSMRDKRQG